MQQSTERVAAHRRRNRPSSKISSMRPSRFRNAACVWRSPRDHAKGRYACLCAPHGVCAGCGSIRLGTVAGLRVVEGPGSANHGVWRAGPGGYPRQPRQHRGVPVSCTLLHRLMRRLHRSFTRQSADASGRFLQHRRRESPQRLRIHSRRLGRMFRPNSVRNGRWLAERAKWWPDSRRWEAVR